MFEDFWCIATGVHILFKLGEKVLHMMSQMCQGKVRPFSFIHFISRVVKES